MRDTVVMYLELILGFCTHTSLFDFVFPCVFALSFNEEFITHTRERERERERERNRKRETSSIYKSHNMGTKHAGIHVCT